MIEPKRDGTPEERSEYFRELQKKSRVNYKGTGGFNALKRQNIERLKEITSSGGRAKWEKYYKPKENQA